MGVPPPPPPGPTPHLPFYRTLGGSSPSVDAISGKGLPGARLTLPQPTRLQESLVLDSETSGLGMDLSLGCGQPERQPPQGAAFFFDPPLFTPPVYTDWIQFRNEYL